MKKLINHSMQRCLMALASEKLEVKMNTFVRSDSLHTFEKPPISKVTMRVDLESDSQLANRFSLPPFAYDTPPERDEDYHHWSPISQPYAPAHVLLQYLREGWQIHERVLVEVSPCISQQCTENVLLYSHKRRCAYHHAGPCEPSGFTFGPGAWVDSYPGSYFF